MSEKQPIRENDFDTARAGTAGAVSYGTGWGTHSSPNVKQNPDHFAQSDNNKALGSTSNTATDAPASGSALNAQVDQIYSNPDSPSVDEVITGMKYELQNMIKKDKARAKEIVLNNLKQDPHYYGKLGMWNIEDDEMMKVEPLKKTQDDPMKERIELLNRMIAERTKKAETPQAIKDAIAETKAKRDARYKK